YNGNTGGLLLNGHSIESLVVNGNTGQNAVAATNTLSSNNISVVSKSLYLDVGKLLDSLSPTGKIFAHEKVEGVALVTANNGDQELVITNDSDFGIAGVTGTGPFTLVPKIDGAGHQDDGEFLVVDLSRVPAFTSTATVSFNVLSNPTITTT